MITNMKLTDFQKVKDGKYLKNYELTYLNRAGKEKKYEMVSRREIKSISEIGKNSSGVSIVAMMDERLLLLKEFRMAVNKSVYNLCSGMMEQGETIEECVRRELLEETGLKLKKIVDILPPSFAAVAISDVKTQLVFVEVEAIPEGEFYGDTSENEEISAAFYTKEQVRKMLETEEFSSRTQLAAYYFTKI